MRNLKPAFKDEMLAHKFRQRTRSWIGTRYAHMGTEKGVHIGGGGVDCTKLMGLILVELGIMATVEQSYYGRDWSIHSDIEIVLMAFTEHMARQLRDPYSYLILKYRTGIDLFLGDCICFAMNSTKGLCSHTAFYMGDGRILHAVDGHGVKEMDYSEHWESKARYIYRIMRKK